MHSFIGGDSAAGLRSVVKQHHTENYSICEQLAALGSAQPGSASPGPERDPCCGLVWQNRAGTGPPLVGQGVTEGCTSLCAGGGVSSIMTHCEEHSLGPFPHLLLYVRIRT